MSAPGSAKAASGRRSPKGDADAPSAAVSSTLIAALGLLLLGAATVLLFWIHIVDPDVLMHLRTGHWILQHREIPRTDIFSSNAFGRSWTTHEWLWEVLAYSGFRVAQWKALYALRVALIAGALGFSIWAAVRLGANVMAAIVACLLAVGPLASFAEIRPQLASECLFALTVLLVQVICLSGASSPQQSTAAAPLLRRVCSVLPNIILPMVFALWANLHGAVLIGFAVLGCGLVAAAISRQWNVLRRLAAGTILSLLAALCNPHGIGIYTFPFKVVGQESFRMQIYEWSRPDFSRPFWPFWVLVLLSAVLVALDVFALFKPYSNSRAASAPKGLRNKAGGNAPGTSSPPIPHPEGVPQNNALTIFHLLVFFLLLVASIGSRRQIPFFALAAVAPSALGIQRILARLRDFAPQPWLAPLAIVLVSSLAVPFTFHCYAAAGHSLGIGLAPNRFPEVAANRLANLHADGALLNDYNDGGFLIWRLYPEWPVTMDGRVDVYGPELVKQYEQVWSGAAGWPDILHKWNVEAILGRFEVTRQLPKHNLCHELAASPDWALVYWDENSQLFLKRGSTLEASGLKPYRLLSPGLSLQQMANRIKSHDDWLALGADLRRSISEVPENRRAQAMLKAYESTYLTNSH